MDYILTPDQMRTLEKTYMDRTGTPSIALMERAASCVARCVMECAGEPGRTAVFVCGRGGNGGDGYAAARLYARSGGRSLILPLFPEDSLSGDALANFRLAKKEPGVAFLPSGALDKLDRPVVWVDAVFGIGLSRPLVGGVRQVFARMETDRLLGSDVISVDIPSGLNGLNGKAYPGTVRATRTVTFECAKTGHYLGDGPDHTGRITVGPLGIDKEFFPEDAHREASPEEARTLLPQRLRNSHKGSFGHLLIVAGSRGMAGAAVLCAKAALRSGVGLVTVACPESLMPILQTAVPCAMALPMPEKDGAFAGEAAPLIAQALSGKTAVALGPGLSTRADPAVVEAVLSCPLPAVVDADGLNLISKNSLHTLLKPRHIITPHPGEGARLMGEKQSDAMTAAEQLWKAGANVVYKGACSLIYARNRRYIRTNGCSGMAKGGSGDVLTGITGALLARGIAPENACWMAAAFHGQAGELAAEQMGENAMTPEDMIVSLTGVWHD